MRAWGAITGFRLLLLILAKSAGVICAAQRNIDASSRAVEEYRPFLPPKVFSKFVSIQSDGNLLLIDKLKQLDTLYNGLSAQTLGRMPLPRAFRRIPPEAQRDARRIYYSKRLPFEEKLAGLDALIQRLKRRSHAPSSAMIKRDAIADDLPRFVPFDVPVLLRFDGKVEIEHLQRYLSPDEFDLLLRILRENGADNSMRARLVGRLLKEAYARHGAYYFPVPLLGATDSSTGGGQTNDELRRLGVQLMFKRNDYDALDPVGARMNALKLGGVAGSDTLPADYTQMPTGGDGTPPDDADNGDDEDDAVAAMRRRGIIDELGPHRDMVRMFDTASYGSHEERLKSRMRSQTMLRRFFTIFPGTIRI